MEDLYATLLEPMELFDSMDRKSKSAHTFTDVSVLNQHSQTVDI